MRIRHAITTAACAAIAFAPAALGAGQTPSQQQYGNPAHSGVLPAVHVGTTGTTGTPGPTVTTPVSSAGQTLPFTGLQLGLVVACGLLLVSLGVAIRRVGRSRES